MSEQEILDNAPDGATHFFDGKHYLKCDVNYERRWFRGNDDVIFVNDYPFSEFIDVRSLADIKRIAELEEDKTNEQHRRT